VAKKWIMATLNAKIFKHHKKADGTYNVKICLTHKDERVYMKTTHFVTAKQINKHLEIKDDFIISCINRTLDNYRKRVSYLSENLDRFSASALKEHLSDRDENVDFLKFCQIFLDQLEKDGRLKSKANYQTVRNSILDFLNNKNILPIEQITPSFIARYEGFLRGKRTMMRKDKYGKEYVLTGRPLPDSTVHVYLRDFRGFFSAAMTYYNKPSLGLNPIHYNPFKEYTIIDAPETQKRSINVDDIIKIRDCETKPLSRADLAKKLGMLSFYLCGMNAVDFYNKQYVINNGRIEYFRSKTKSKRKDRAFISIKIPSEAENLLQFAALIPSRYNSIGNLNKAISKGMAELCMLTKISGLQYYSFRHSFGTHARNTCRKSKDDVALALNHIDQGRKTTDIYLAKDWTIIDEVQEAVLNLIRTNKKQSQFNANVKLILSNIELPKLTS
jgi:integrase